MIKPNKIFKPILACIKRTLRLKLLETSPQDPRYLQDALMACVVAACWSLHKRSKLFVQTVASNLIAQNQLREGIQLLLLINKGLDACQYLQNRSQWDEAALLAKVRIIIQMEID